MKHGGWVPISKGMAEHLPRREPFRPVEAAFQLQLDYDNGHPVTLSGYSAQWGWGKERVKRFLDELGVEIYYPENTGRRQNQRGFLRQTDNGLKTDRKQTDIRLKRFIDSKWIDDPADRKQTDIRPRSDRKPVTTINPDPKPEPKPKSSSSSSADPAEDPLRETLQPEEPDDEDEGRISFSELKTLYVSALGKEPVPFNIETLKALRKEYSPEEIRAAFEKAAERGGRSLAYVIATLENEKKAKAEEAAFVAHLNSTSTEDQERDERVRAAVAYHRRLAEEGVEVAAEEDPEAAAKREEAFRVFQERMRELFPDEEKTNPPSDEPGSGIDWAGDFPTGSDGW